ncbi:hypothetical protein ACS0TY_025891 [Phlomoides rotata]
MANTRVLMLFLIVVVAIFSTVEVNGAGGLKCCFDNHIGECVPGKDDPKCNSSCQQSNCSKGGSCKVLGKKPPNHFCHCFC